MSPNFISNDYDAFLFALKKYLAKILPRGANYVLATTGLRNVGMAIYLLSFFTTGLQASNVSTAKSPSGNKYPVGTTSKGAGMDTETLLANDDESLLNTPTSYVIIPILENDISDVLNAVDESSVSVDLDPSTDEFENELAVPGEGGWVYNVLTGELVFTPETGFGGNPTVIEYRLKNPDTGFVSETGTVTVTYNQFDLIAENDQFDGFLPGEIAEVNVLANDKLSDGTQVTFDRVTFDINENEDGEQVTLVVPDEGTWTYDPVTGVLSFDPDEGFTIAPAPINYTFKEIATGKTEGATVTIEYNVGDPVSEDDDPVGSDPTKGYVPGTTVTINILENDLLSDGSPATTTATDVDVDLFTTDVQHEYTADGEGLWTYDPATGDLTFDPNDGYTITPSKLNYELIELSTLATSMSSVLLTYKILDPTAENDNDPSTSYVPGESATIYPLDNDKLSDGSIATKETVTVSLYDGSIGVELPVPGIGTWKYGPTDGTITFEPEGGFSGSPEPIAYYINETLTNRTASAMITLKYDLVEAIANDDSNMDPATPGNEATINILENDFLGDKSAPAPDRVSVDIDPADGIQSFFIVTGEGEWTYNDINGELTFNPDPGFTTDPTEITYWLTEIATESVSMAKVNFLYDEFDPEANDDSNSVPGDPGDNVTISILENDKLSDETGATVATTTVDMDMATDSEQLSLVVEGEGTWTYNPITGEVTFDPEPGFTTDPTPVTYTLTETLTGRYASALISVYYDELNPVAEDDRDEENTSGGTVTVSILKNDKLSDGTDLFNGTSTLVEFVDVDLNYAEDGTQHNLLVDDQGEWTYDPVTGDLTFEPVEGFNKDPDMLSYKLIETLTNTTDYADVTITYSNTAPVINAVDYSFTSQPHVGDIFTLDGGSNPPAPSGTDAEEGILGGSTRTSTLIITELPTNAELYYDFGTGSELINVIPVPMIFAFDASKISLKLTVAGVTSAMFNYTFADSKGKQGTPVEYKISWTYSLPVTLAAFSAKKEGASSLLSWSTASEVNSKEFDVQHSINATVWKTIGKVATRGGAESYSFVHVNPAPGQNLYRLRMVDLDGSFTLSRTVQVTHEKADAIFTVQNPAAGTQFAVITNAENPSFELTNLSGASTRIMVEPASNGYLIKVTDFTPGIYLLTMTKNAKKQVRKIVIP